MGGLQDLALGCSEVNKDWILWTDEMKGETGTGGGDRQGGTVQTDHTRKSGLNNKLCSSMISYFRGGGGSNFLCNSLHC